MKTIYRYKHFVETFRFITQAIIDLIQMEYLKNSTFFCLKKIDNGLSNKPKRLNKMFTSILAKLFLGKLFLKSKFYLLLNEDNLLNLFKHINMSELTQSCDG